MDSTPSSSISFPWSVASTLDILTARNPYVSSVTSSLNTAANVNDESANIEKAIEDQPVKKRKRRPRIQQISNSQGPSTIASAPHNETVHRSDGQECDPNLQIILSREMQRNQKSRSPRALSKKKIASELLADNCRKAGAVSFLTLANAPNSQRICTVCGEEAIGYSYYHSNEYSCTSFVPVSLF